MLDDASIPPEGCNATKSLISRGNEQIDRLAKGIGAVEHGISGAPSDIAVEGDFERLSDSTLNLKFFEGLNALTGGLDLTVVSIHQYNLRIENKP